MWKLKEAPLRVALRDQIAMATISGLLAQGFGFGLEDRLEQIIDPRGRKAYGTKKDIAPRLD